MIKVTNSKVLLTFGSEEFTLLNSSLCQVFGFLLLLKEIKE